jgi:hypothetical protein
VLSGRGVRNELITRRCVWSRNIKNRCSIYIYDISNLRVNYFTLLTAITLVQKYRLWKSERFRNLKTGIISRKNVKIAFFERKVVRNASIYMLYCGPIFSSINSLF